MKMVLSERNKDILLLGCGKMGGALLQGWVAKGIPLSSLFVIEPFPNDTLLELAQNGLNLNENLPKHPAMIVLAVKPQMMNEALPQIAHYKGGEGLFISIAAGVTLKTFNTALPNSPIIRAMPNTPAAIRQGITALIGNEYATASHLKRAEELLSSIGKIVRLNNESEMDAVTALSGSGPAYVFYLIEAMTEAGIAEGLHSDSAHDLAITTVAGAAALALQSKESPRQLRKNVTSPNGTTEAALKILMNEEDGLRTLMRSTIKEAARRSRELGEE